MESTPLSPSPESHDAAAPMQSKGLLSQDPNMKENPKKGDAENKTPSSLSASVPKPLRSKKLGAGFFLGCFGLFAFLFVLFVVLSVVTLQANPNNAFFQQLNLSSADVQRILSGLVNVSFGLFSLILLLALVVTVFGRILMKKEDKEQRKKSGVRSMLLGAGLILDLIIWIFVSYSIASIPVGDTKLQGDILVYDAQTNQLLSSSSGLTAPVELLFDASNVTKRVKQGIQILSYNWDLDGDGKFGDKTGEKVTWKYEDKGKNNGIYPVRMKLVVQDAQSKTQEQDFPLYVTIDAVKPKIVLKVDQTTGDAPLAVKFDASESVDPDGQNPKDISFAWDLDNANKFTDGDQPVFTHTFDTIGTFTVRLRVEDRDHKFSIAEQTITVTGVKQDGPQAKILAAPAEGPAPLTVSFSGENSTTQTGKIVKYEWNFGDSSLPDKSVTTSHTFNKIGTYTVQLQVTDDQNKTGTSSTQITVTGKSTPPVIKLMTQPTYQEQFGQKVLEGDVPFVVNFDAAQSTDKENDIVDYQWDLDGDGVFETRGAKPAAYTYYDQDEKTIQLKVIDSAGNETLEKVLVRVKYKPLEAIIKASPLSGAAPLTVAFDGSASRYNNGTIEQYQWDFNDGTPPKIYNALIQYTFSKVGLYQVKLTVLTNDGKQASSTQNIIVTDVPLIARFNTNVKNGIAPLNVVFDPSSSTGKIVKYFWDFGDGVVSSERKPTHTFTAPGTYTVVLKISSQDNISSQYSDQITVQ